MSIPRTLTRLALASLLPVVVAVVAASLLVERAQQRQTRASVERAARVTLAALGHELGAAVSSLVADAEPLPDADTTVAAVRAALGGDTVRALDPTASGVDVMVLAPDTAGGVRFNASRMEPGGPTLVGRIWGASVALYANGRLWAGTDPPPGPAALGESALRAATRNASGVWTEEGFVLALDPREGARPAVVALASSPELRTRAVSAPVYLALAALMALTLVVAWLLFLRAEPARLRRVIPPLALLPALVSAALLAHFADSIRSREEALLSRDLSRALAVAEEMDLLTSTQHLHALTGFEAVWMERGEPVASSDDDLAAAARTLRAPPPNFTSSGTARTPKGAWRWVARRTGPGSFVVVGATLPEREQRRLLLSLAALAVLMIAASTWGTVMVVRSLPATR